MRSLERTRHRGIDQAAIEDDRKHIETRTHGDNSTRVTWDDLASVRSIKDLIDSLPSDSYDDETTQANNRELIEANQKELEKRRSYNTIGDFARGQEKPREQRVADARE